MSKPISNRMNMVAPQPAHRVLKHISPRPMSQRMIPFLLQIIFAMEGAGQINLVDGTDAAATNFTMPAIGAIVVGGDGKGRSVCTGTLVCANVVLTAAHCLAENVPGFAGKTTRTYFIQQDDVRPFDEVVRDPDKADAWCADNEACFSVTQSWFAPKYHRNGNTEDIDFRFDVALLQLDGRVNLENYPQISDSAPTTCSEHVIIGYGQASRAEENVDSSLVLRWGMTEVEGVVRAAFLDWWPTIGLLKSESHRRRGEQDTAYLAHGDSGGPLFSTTDPLDQQTTQITNALVYGVASVIPNNSSSARVLLGHKVQFHTPLHLHKPQLQQKIGELCQN